MMDPASSSSSSSDEESTSSVEESRSNNHWKSNVEEGSEEEEEEDDDENKAPSPWDDLPSEDSCMEEEDDDDEEDVEELTIAERVYANKNHGSNSKRKDVEKKKKDALALAQKRIKKMKQQQEEDTKETDEEQIEKKAKKRSKHAPTEASSKRRRRVDVNGSGLGVEIGANRYKPHDPRMESLSGFLDQNVFERRYAFLEAMEKDEIQKLKDRIAARSMKGKKGQKKRKKLGLTMTTTTLEQDKEDLIRMKQLQQQRNMGQVQRAAKQSVKKKLREEVAQGKRGAFYLKRNEQKRLEQEARYEELKKRGGESAVAKALAKKRKKNQSKQTKLMPT